MDDLYGYITARIDEEIELHEKEIAKLKDAKSALLEILNLPLPPTVHHIKEYKVSSRTGGKPHVIRLFKDGSFNCSCPAGENGRICWALEGLRHATGDGLRPGSGYFYDESNIMRYYMRTF